MKHTSLSNRLTIIVAALWLATFAIALLLLPKRDFSVKERRALASFPEVRAEALLDGRFFASLSSFYSDHFPLRERFTALKAKAELALGKKENNGILIGKNGYLIARGEYSNLAIAERNLVATRMWMDRASLPITVSILPRTVDVMTSELPRGYENNARTREIEALTRQMLPQSIDLATLFREAAKHGESLFYRTDHHWTTEGAYLAYVHLAPSLGIEPYTRETFTPVAVTEHFLGTSFSRSGLSHAASDTITLYRYAEDDAYTVIHAETKARTHSLYHTSALSADDPYEVFLGGNASRLFITDEAHPQRPTLLLYKDSFANALVPFLARHFQLVIVDPRYEQQGLSAICEEFRPDRVLILFGADTVATTPALARIGR